CLSDWSSDVCSSDLKLFRVSPAWLDTHQTGKRKLAAFGVLGQPFSDVRRAARDIKQIIGDLKCQPDISAKCDERLELFRSTVRRSEERRVGKECRCR